jgi:peptide/nickel transport system ATP-binding protein
VLKDVSLAIAPGEAWGLIGASGSGKTTLLNLLLGLLEPTEGHIDLVGEPWSPLAERDRRARRPLVQAVFQEALASLPPHRTGWDILQEPLEVWRRGNAVSRRAAAARMAARVKFPEALLGQKPGAWSGGLAQRLCLGRALMLGPALLVLDEPFSALDPTLGQHLQILLRCLKEEGLALLLATHDLPSVQGLCDQVILLRDGRTLCQGPAGSMFSEPPQAHLRELLEAVPRL